MNAFVHFKAAHLVLKLLLDLPGFLPSLEQGSDASYAHLDVFSLRSEQVPTAWHLTGQELLLKHLYLHFQFVEGRLRLHHTAISQLFRRGRYLRVVLRQCGLCRGTPHLPEELGLLPENLILGLQIAVKKPALTTCS